MALPNLTIKLENGGLGRVSQLADGVAGMLVDGQAENGFELNKVYQFSSIRDLKANGITQEKNPLLCKDVLQFYRQAGDGAELYVMAVAKGTTLTAIFKDTEEAEAPIRQLIRGGKRRIRLVGVNVIPILADDALEGAITERGIMADSINGARGAQKIAEEYAGNVNPFRIFIPAHLRDLDSEKFYEPKTDSNNRVAFVMAADDKVEGKTSAAIGQILGTAASIPVHRSIARVKNGAVATEGWLTNGKTIDDSEGILEMLDDAKYIIYRSFIGKNGYYFNDDHTAAPDSDDYSSIALGRVIDKAIILAYGAYIDEIMENVEVDENGNIPPSMCVYYQNLIENAVNATMNDEISSFQAYVDPAQNILSTSTMNVSCKIVPKGILRSIIVNLGFENPALNS